MYKYIGKRILDFTVSVFAIVILSPVFFVIIILLFITNKGVPFFVQARPGKDAQIFRIIKFKTMNDQKGDNGELLPDYRRLTKTGSFIRRTSLDELPQLFNVLLGNMSLIGPRPLLVEYLSLYNHDQMKRHDVRPGITGWAQVNGRNAISWNEKFKYDIYYINNLSLSLDLKIFFLTIKKVLYREDISSKTSATMESFKGN